MSYNGLTAAEATRPLAVVTGASSGIGYELAKLFAEDGFDLVVAADTPLAEPKQAFEALGARVETLQADLHAAYQRWTTLDAKA